MIQRLSRKMFGALFGAALALLCTLASAAVLQFGTRSLQVPDPDGYAPLSGVAPRYISAAQAYLPSTNRLVEAYATPDQAKELEQGRPAVLTRYFQLQAPRRAEGTIVSETEFSEASKEIEGELEKTMRNSKELADKLTEQGNAEMKRMTTTDPKIALNGTEYLGAFRREPWGLFFTIRSGVSAADGSHQTLACGGALVLVNYQLLFMYAYAQYHDESDRRWVEQAVSSWADATRAANPNDPALGAKASRGFFGGGVLRTALIGALIGGLVGLIGSVLRKRKQ